jgi:ubiquinone/menaquinone biosynthesis C-methylase UbiE
MGLIQKLIEQSKQPTGRLGKTMLRIMNNAHRSMALLAISKLKPCENVLDVSCGGGDALRLLAEAGKFERIYGIDFSPDAVTLAAKLNKNNIEKGLISVKEASVLELPFENEYFDAVITVQSHYHWQSVLEAMKEIRRVLRPKGQFVLVAEVYKIGYHMEKYNDVEGSKKLFEDSGFTRVDLSADNKIVCVAGYK